MHPAVKAKAKYEVYAEGPAKVTERRFVREEIVDSKGKGIGKYKLTPQTVQQEYPETFRVYFLHGHSTRFLTKEDMNAAGVFESGIGYVDPDTGDAVDGPMPEMSLRDRNLANTLERSMG